jgi:hypothetical protein
MRHAFFMRSPSRKSWSYELNFGGFLLNFYMGIYLLSYGHTSSLYCHFLVVSSEQFERSSMPDVITRNHRFEQEVIGLFLFAELFVLVCERVFLSTCQ